MKLIICLFCCSMIYAQESRLIADYTYITKFDELPTATSVNSRLISNGLESNYEMDFVGNLDFVELEAGVKGGSVIAIKADKNPVIYKNHENRFIYSIERIFLKPFLVRDSMNIFDWKIHSVKKEILGYACQKATASYRGRNYTAYFTTKIPFETGPWKFYGLPGLILQVQSNDGVLKIKANRIQIKKDSMSINNPFKDYETDPISWEVYTDAYSKKYEELKRYRDQYGSRTSIPKKIIETLVKPKFLFTID